MTNSKIAFKEIGFGFDFTGLQLFCEKLIPYEELLTANTFCDATGF